MLRSMSTQLGDLLVCHAAVGKRTIRASIVAQVTASLDPEGVAGHSAAWDEIFIDDLNVAVGATLRKQLIPQPDSPSRRYLQMH